jgi:SAM-dependent methyltransferase
LAFIEILVEGNLKMKRPSYHTRSVLERVVPKYCRGYVLDAGAGRAKYKQLIHKHSTNYVALDNLSSSFQFSYKLDHKLDVIGDIMSLPFRSEVFDTVVCTQVIEHVPEPQKLMHELSRVLKRGGYLILSTGWVSPYHPEPKDYYRFSVDALVYLLTAESLEVVEIIPQGGVLLITLYFWSRLIELHHPRFFHFLQNSKVLRVTELVCEGLEQLPLFHFGKKDAVGYTVVGFKP